jgi:hypothetical protein
MSPEPSVMSTRFGTLVNVSVMSPEPSDSVTCPLKPLTVRLPVASVTVIGRPRGTLCHRPSRTSR